MEKELAKNRIKKNFISLLQLNELRSIKVTQLCKQSKVNRSTFYANYIDIYDLSDKLSAEIEDKYLYMLNLDTKGKKLEQGFSNLFTDVKNNPSIYTAYFKINPDKALIFKERSLEELANKSYLLAYNSIFYRTGITATIKLWLKNDCYEPVEDMVSLIMKKYSF